MQRKENFKSFFFQCFLWRNKTFFIEMKLIKCDEIYDDEYR